MNILRQIIGWFSPTDRYVYKPLKKPTGINTMSKKCSNPPPAPQQKHHRDMKTISYNNIYSEIIRACIEQQEITHNLVGIFDLPEEEITRKFQNWMKTQPFTNKIGYKKIIAGDFSFLDA